MNHGAESHQYLKLFTNMSIPAGIALIVAPFLFLREKMESGPFVLLAIAMAALGIGLIGGSFYTQRVTDHFRKWNQGLTHRQKVIPIFVMTIGGWMSLAFFWIIPFIWNFSRRD